MDNDSSNRILSKQVYLLKRHMDNWVDDMLICPAHLDFNKSHLTLLLSIGTKGLSNNALACHLNISKQATSKVIKELEAINLVKSERCYSDSRAVTLHLTDEGIKLHRDIVEQIALLENDYKKLVGPENYEAAINVLLKIKEYHEERSKVVLN
jgi:DNA-binding MarR family transcriptional regulator